ncbi:MAG: LysE family transporter [Bacteroidales bacterium]|nr:lysine transporter LysE [Bacteroidales bacterium]MBQ3521350.1 LysE family transporter [Bacteroidales bacterium]MBQ6870870.1 LysE family transporter [Bacteroidales bacterium]MBQ7999284.1 LysE family transporter [Bacteroidales bacterium]MBQ8034504.1 LysE family transporter [Bacteroidales bacterium]
MLVTLLKGFIVGLGASIPLGPLGVLCVQKTLSKGRNSGLFTGLGASVSDTFYAGLSLIGLSFVENLINENRAIVMLVGGIIIALIGLKVYTTNPIKQIRQKSSNKRHLEDFVEALVMTITNPGAIFLILGLFAAVGINSSDNAGNISIITTLWGVFLGTATWWFILTTTINVFRKKFRLKQLMMINRIAGIIIAVLGIISACDGIVKLILAR